MSNHPNSRSFHTHIEPFPNSNPPYRSEVKQTRSQETDNVDLSRFQARSTTTLNRPELLTRIVPPPSSRMMQGAADAAKIKPAIQAYLRTSDPVAAGERTVIIMTSKVAQKSYGTERRFLCPPPNITIIGMNWWTPAIASEQYGSHEKAIFRDNYGIMRAPPILTICISGESTDQQQGRVEWYNRSGTLVGQTGSLYSSTTQLSSSNPPTAELVKSSTLSKLAATEDWYQNNSSQSLAGGRCVLKRLFINDADEKRKRVECLVRVQLANGLMLGTLSSRAIKVISKPSKKRQSVKNVDLCIYHGTTISLFNRVRSQTVSTRYLGVSSASRESASFDYPGSTKDSSTSDTDTCFVAKTDNWDSFVIWRIDPNEKTTTAESSTRSEAAEYIGCPSIVPTIPYPEPPTIALKNKTKQPLAIRYNQHVVLQCLTTGLVSPVMIVRKVDKASTVVGGARSSENIDPSFTGGGEFGDEVLGDPVSQLHKVALQIINPGNKPNPQNHADNNFYVQQNHYGMGLPDQRYDMNKMPEMADGSATYLACLNDLVGTHKTAHSRIPVRRNPPISMYNPSSMFPPGLSPSLSTDNTNMAYKRRLSMIDDQPFGYNFQQSGLFGDTDNDGTGFRRRVSSLNDIQARSSSAISSSQQHKSTRKGSIASGQKDISNNDQLLAELGSYWCEDVNDASVWTIVGTECAKYTFWTPPYLDNSNPQHEQLVTAPLSTPFPCLMHFSISNENISKKNLKLYRSQDTHTNNTNDRNEKTVLMTITGENFTRDLQIWLGDIKATFTEYRSKEMLVCRLPSRHDLLESAGLENISSFNEDSNANYRIRILLVRGDGVVYKTSRYYAFS
ncbi:LAG1-DNAbind-domain-containing protein [Backusella circina FSU 941]|nr:LAG1-DNAbind-domain-containing protein [Backusella circina FSU 941]